MSSEIDVRVSDFELVVEPLKDQTPVPPEIEIEDNTYQDDYPGEDDPIDVVPRTKVLAQRVTAVSDVALMGSQSLIVPAGSLASPVALIIPRHRDRLRVRVGVLSSSANVLLGHSPNLYSAADGWTLEPPSVGTAVPNVLIETRDAIYAMAYITQTSEDDTIGSVQWITELVTETCGCGASK